MSKRRNLAGLLGELPAAVKQYVWSARVGDFALLATIPVLGFAYGIQSVSLATVFTGAAVAAASLLSSTPASLRG